MARNKRGEGDAERRAHQAEIDRYNAMRKVVAVRPKRTMGDLFTLRKAACDTLADALVRQNEVLSRVYGGLTGPPDTGRWNACPHHRTLFCRVPHRERLKAVRFGWSFREPYPEDRKRGWVMSYSEDWYEGYGDHRLIRDVCGREPKGQIDQLVCCSEVTEALQQNDEALAMEFDDVSHRVNQLWQRCGVLRAEIISSIHALLEQRHNWRADKTENWRRLTFEDGTIVTVTGEGEVVFGETITNLNFSLLDPTTKRKVYPGLAKRQQQAQERQ